MTERTLRRISPKRIILSGSVIAIALAMVIGATGAFFSDEETSTGNVFTAGAIDLQIDNTSYGFDWNDPEETDPTGEWRLNPNNSWQLTDLTNELFFNFHDLKPGDYGEDTISLHVNNNDAWACMAFNLSGTPENGQTEPEEQVDPTDGEDEGELQNYLSFLFWWDDGDNVLEVGEELIESLSGLSGDIFTGDWLTIADSEEDEPIEGGTTHYIGKGWCFGNITATPVAPGDHGAPTVGNTGFTCSGEGDHNDAQTDGITVDVGFHAEQSRNNGQFLCANLPPFEPEEPNGEQRPLVGAALDEYEAPESCTTTVSDVGGLVSAVDGASDNDTICVEDGDYDLTDPLVIDVDGLTLAAENGPLNTSTITGGIFVDASNVTITGFVFDGFDFMGASENAAIYVHNETGQGSGTSLEGLEISYNIFDAPAGAADSITTVDGGTGANAVINEIASSATPQFSNSVIKHNRFDGWRRGVFLNPSSGIEVAYNDFYNNFVGSANDGPNSNSIHNNDFEDNSAEDVGVAPSADNGTGNDGIVTVNTNNFAPGGVADDVNWYGSSVLGGADVDATGNWWDGDVEGDRTNDPAEVDTSSPEAVAFPEN